MDQDEGFKSTFTMHFFISLIIRRKKHMDKDKAILIGKHTCCFAGLNPLAGPILFSLSSLHVQNYNPLFFFFFFLQ